MARFSNNPLRAYQHARATGQLQASPPAVLAGSFVLLILAGTILLSLPIAQIHSFSIFQAFFTATSAVTVTGLMVINPAHDLTVFGQAVVLILVQFGGVGFVTFAIVASLSLGRRVSLKYQALAMEAFNQTNVMRIRHTAITVLKFTLVIELAAILVLTLWWWRHYDFVYALSMAGFHVISAFNNAGIALFPDSLVGFSSDPVTVFVITACIIMGGIGFSVLADIYHKRAWLTLSYYTRLVLLATLMLNLLGFALFWLIESSNPLTLENLSIASQGLASWTQVVAARTAGFASMDPSLMRDSSRLLLMGLMFIGGGSLSTASGIKLGTFIVLLAVVRSYVVQRKEVVLMGRTIAAETIYKSLALLVVSTLLVWLGIFLLSAFENLRFIDVVMEILSAFTTTGLGSNITPNLSTPSHILLMILMFIGRLGPLTLVYSLGTQKNSLVRYPETQIQIG